MSRSVIGAGETTGTIDRRVGNREVLDLLDVPEHPRRLIEACFDLDRVYPDRRLMAWAHMLGFRGHFSSKSRRYSTTLGALRQVRADYRAAQQNESLGLADTEPDSVLVLASWQYAGQGHSPGESVLAASKVYDLIRSKCLVSITEGRARRIPEISLQDYIRDRIEETA